MKTSARAAAAGVVLALALSGCQASSPDLSTETAEQLQSRVLSITTSVANGDHTAAMEALAVLETELDAAAQNGTVSFPRHQRIEAALVTVRSDVQAALDAAVPEPEPEPEPEPVTPAPPVTDDDEGDDDGENGNGSGNGNGNGNGNGKDKDKRDNPKKNNGNGNGRG